MAYILSYESQRVHPSFQCLFLMQIMYTTHVVVRSMRTFNRTRIPTKPTTSCPSPSIFVVGFEAKWLNGHGSLGSFVHYWPTTLNLIPWQILLRCPTLDLYGMFVINKSIMASHRLMSASYHIMVHIFLRLPFTFKNVQTNQPLTLYKSGNCRYLLF